MPACLHIATATSALSPFTKPIVCTSRLIRAGTAGSSRRRAASARTRRWRRSFALRPRMPACAQKRTRRTRSWFVAHCIAVTVARWVGRRATVTVAGCVASAQLTTDTWQWLFSCVVLKRRCTGKGQPCRFAESGVRAKLLYQDGLHLHRTCGRWIPSRVAMPELSSVWRPRLLSGTLLAYLAPAVALAGQRALQRLPPCQRSGIRKLGCANHAGDHSERRCRHRRRCRCWWRCRWRCCCRWCCRERQRHRHPGHNTDCGEPSTQDRHRGCARRHCVPRLLLSARERDLRRDVVFPVPEVSGSLRHHGHVAGMFGSENKVLERVCAPTWAANTCCAEIIVFHVCIAVQTILQNAVKPLDVLLASTVTALQLQTEQQVRDEYLRQCTEQYVAVLTLSSLYPYVCLPAGSQPLYDCTCMFARPVIRVLCVLVRACACLCVLVRAVRAWARAT